MWKLKKKTILKFFLLTLVFFASSWTVTIATSGWYGSSGWDGSGGPCRPAGFES